MFNPSTSKTMKIKLQFGELNITPSVAERLEELGFDPENFANDVAEHKSDCDGNPSVYVGTWAKYNEGDLTGLWIDLTTFDDREDFVNFCYAIHADERDPELDAQDWECLPNGIDGDDLFFEQKWDVLKEYLELGEKYELDAVEAFVNRFSIDCLSDFENCYCGKFDSELDYAYHIIDECYDLDDIMGDLSSYFDYQRYADDLFMDYAFEDGYVFRS